jgi:hypothetical protein
MAAVAAAQHHAPGLIGKRVNPRLFFDTSTQGRWLRRGRKIIVLDI